MIDRFTREHIRRERSKIYLSRINVKTLMMYGDGLCYQCNRLMDAESKAKFCSKKCRSIHASLVEVGYGPEKERSKKHG